MTIGPMMKGVGRKVFYINCLYGVEMRGEEDTVGVMARELTDVWDSYRIADRKCVYVLRAAQGAAVAAVC